MRSFEFNQNSKSKCSCAPKTYRYSLYRGISTIATSIFYQLDCKYGTEEDQIYDEELGEEGWRRLEEGGVIKDQAIS